MRCDCKWCGDFGRSRHGAPDRNAQKMPLRTREDHFLDASIEAACDARNPSRKLEKSLMLRRDGGHTLDFITWSAPAAAKKTLHAGPR